MSDLPVVVKVDDLRVQPVGNLVDVFIDREQLEGLQVLPDEIII